MEGEVKGKTYKMKGRTLPGINQRSEGNTDLSDGRSKSSAFQQAMTTGMMGAAQALHQRRNPITPGAMGGVGTGMDTGMTPPLVSKPSVAKIYATKGKRKPNPGKY